ncbi:MAG: DEAD/DEAH box helicase family protein [Pseudomonadota bacterium]
MKIQFNPNLDFQHEAINSVTDIFKGQEICRTNFTIAPIKYDPQTKLEFENLRNDLGIGNHLKLGDEDIFENIKAIQLRNGLAPSESLDSLNFTVEMETGTGKTYVYLRSIFELNRLYGFTKFIIVVPSVAIKEGVYKSLQMTETHFKGLYENVQFDYFIYDSQKPGPVRNFATSDYIQIMVINIDAFRKSFTDPEKEDKANIIHRPHEKMAGNRPIEFIQATKPIVIIDEPQSVDTTSKSKEAIASLNPLCALRYSATHVEKYHMMYKLDSVDAYQQKLVKQIEVSGIEIKDSHNKAFIRLLKVDNKKSPITAQIEIDAKQRTGYVKRVKKTVRSGNDLLEISGGRSIYDGYIIEDIYCEKGNEYISFTSKPDIVRLNQAIGEVNDEAYKRLQIRKTIEKHLENEKELRPRGLKVLSLFFIDRVSNYRWYDDKGNPQPGIYAKIFEEEYNREITKPKYYTLFDGADLETTAQDVHNGYFAIDKKKTTSGRSVEIFKDSHGEGKASADESAYRLIMQDKERLLSFDTKLKFIFSHSALKEGWDNPNVFQICTLNETSSVMKKRQEIGRGLRIAVNQDGERVHGFDVNTLTVMANESYEEFAKQLQKEIEEETGIKFGIIEKHIFANILVPTDGHQAEYLGIETSHLLWNHLESEGYIDKNGKVQNLLRSDLKESKVILPEKMADVSQQILAIIQKTAGKLNIRNSDDRKKAELNKAVYLSDDFQQLWEKIKYKTTFRVDFDPKKLIEKCADEINKTLIVGRTRFITRTATLDVDRGGVNAQEVYETMSVYNDRDYDLPDLVSYLQNETNLTRRSIVAILKASGRLQDFKNNPQKFIEQVTSIIKHQMQVFIVDGIKYERIGYHHYYAQEIFKENELYGYLKKNMLESKKSVFDHIVYDSDIEADFARSFELSKDVKVYAKLSGWFKIETPLGSYNPDWAVLVETENQQRLYFVVESKGSRFSEELRITENAKIQCGRKHFKALENNIDFMMADNYSTFSEKISSTDQNT